MKKQLLLNTLFVFFAIAGYAQWSHDSLNVGRSLLGGVTFGDKVYFIGGETGIYTYPLYETAEVAVYDCLASAWLPSDSLSLGRSAAACISGDSAIYVAGGRIWDRLRRYPSSAIFNFDATNRVDIFKSGVWHADSLPDRVWGGRAVKVGSRLMFTGFVDSINYLTSEIFASKKVYIFDESTEQWSTDSLSSARTELGAASDGNIAIFAGGVNGFGVTSDVVDIYHASTGTWTTANLSVARGYVGATYSNGKFYFAGGVLQGAFNVTTDVIDIYDGSAWTTDHLSFPRAGVAAVAIGNKVFFMGGSEFDLSFLPYANSLGTYYIVDVLNVTDGSWSLMDFTMPYTYPWSGGTCWHQYAGVTTWGNKIFVGGGGYYGLNGNNNLYSPYVEILDVTLGFTDVAGAVSFDAYPNPSHGPVTLLLPEAGAEIRITDLAGQEVMRTNLQGRRVELALDQSGLYLVNVITRHGTATRKIVVSR